MLSILFSIVFSVSSAQAFIPNAKMPVCLDGRNEMQIDNQRVIEMKHNTPNQYLDRGFIDGVVIRPPSIENGHQHFSLALSNNKKDTIEIVYNNDFGTMPQRPVLVGDHVVVCGDYITSFARGGGYDASPDGALIHWVHYNPATRSGSMKHEHGFMMFGSDLVGFDSAPAGAWDGTIIPGAQNQGDNRAKNNNRGNQNNRNQNDNRRAYNNRGNQRQPARNSNRSAVCRSLAECSSRNGR